ncbi:DUF551 domain-containing protein [Acinetobacter pittii]|nr:DUF551 domain-containing protein [Acinetobacter pittii]MDX8202050.1 DUF551 domain-containing protein [Acinetobacter pittii]MDX8227764.1 DUF551 domain-containing protein [Acinetobacter pittii]WPP82785.1 DUF551 domain-containing protein [Acinetobacter pittii]
MVEFNKRSGFEQLWLLNGGHFKYFYFSETQDEYVPTGIRDNLSDDELILSSVTLNTAYLYYISGFTKAASTWISVNDQEPPVDTTVLVCWSDSPDVQPEMDYMTTDEDLNRVWANYDNDPPSHWMHLHKVPSESGAEG